MKRIMKKVLLVLVGVLLSLTVGVNAASYAVGTSFTNSRTGYVYAPGFGSPTTYIQHRDDNNGVSYDPNNTIYRYNAISIYEASNSGNTYNSYCLDPSGHGEELLKVNRELTAVSTGKEYAWEVGMLSVLNNEGNSYYTYEDMSAALRFVTSAFGQHVYGSSNDYAYGRMLTKVYISTSAKWISESEDSYVAWYQAFYGTNPSTKLSGTQAFDAVLKALYGAQPYDNYGVDVEKDFVFFSNNDAGNNALARQKALFIQAIKTAGPARLAGVANRNQNYKLIQTDAGSMKEIKRGNDTYLYRDIMYVVNTSLYNRTRGFIKNFQVSSSYRSLITLEYSTDGTNYHTLNANTNLVSLSSNKVYVKVHFEGLKSELQDCEEMTYSINYKYYDPSFDTKAYLLTGGYSGYAGSYPQRFVIITKDNLSNTGLNGTISGTTELCGACDTEINIPKDCTELGESVNTEDVISNISAPELVTKCVLKKNDDAGNSYKLSTCGGGVEDNNPYCSVYCKEDYATVRFSGIKQAQSGRYFKVSGHMEGTKTCYTSSGTNTTGSHAINTAQYETDIAAAQTELIAAYIEFKKVNTACDNHVASGSLVGPGYHVGNNGQVVIDTMSAGYDYSYDLANCSTLKTQASNRLTNAQNKYNMINSQYNSCTNWTNTFNFNQDIYYTYSENYSKQLGKEQTKMNKSCSGTDCVTEKTDWYCSGDLSSTDRGRYNSCTTAPTNTVPTTTRSYIYCDANGCSARSTVVPTAKYVKKSVKAATDYTSNNQFYNIYTSGEITIQDVLNSDLNAKIVDGSPVSVRTEIGVYTFNYKIVNLGEFYDTCTLGRLSGANNSVVNKLNNEGTIKFDGDYICYYTVDCPECELECIGPDNNDDCHWIPNCPTCDPIIEQNTLYSDKLNVEFRPVTSSNINPNERELGYNWNESTEYELISAKASDTKEEIESKGALVENEEPILSVQMTPQLASKIKEYNKSQESNGGYANNSMVCYNYNDGTNKYENVFCFSKFLDEISKDNNAFKFTPSRIAASIRNGMKDETQLSKEITNSGYWTIYQKANNYDLGTYNGTVGGPSWK